MGTVHISAKEQREMIDSQEHSLDLVRSIYMEIAQWRMHGLESHQKKANDLKRQLDNHLEDIMPFHVADTNSYSPPAQKRKKTAYGGRRTRKA
jgi:hypothetical protein